MSTAQSEVAGRGHNGAGGRTIAVDDPATGKVIGHVPDMDASEVGELVRRARAAQAGWQALGFDGRGQVMRDARRWLIQNRERMLATIIGETGKTREDAQNAELMYISDAFGFWAKKAPKYLADEPVRPHSPLLLGKKMYVRHLPFGVVGVIGPWNYPLNNCFGDAIPALMAGNAVVMKPSEATPLSALLMAEGMRAAGMPEDVLTVATGRAEAGSALIDGADMIMFTGSTATGKKVMARAAETLTPVSLELGGKDPMVVLRDADIEKAANAAVFWGFSNSGQICISVERVYVEAPVHDEFVAKVVEKTRALRQGQAGGAGSVDVGAITFGPQLDIIESHVRDAVERGAKVEVGGARRGGDGRFFEPTVLTGVDHSMQIMTEETFGPTLPIMKVEDPDEAVRLANDSRYGLDSSVWTTDIAKGREVAERINAGATCVNDSIINYAALELPFGGTGESGIGVRHGAGGIRKYCRTHSVVVTRRSPKRAPYMFPYSKRATKLFERVLVLLYGRGPKVGG